VGAIAAIVMVKAIELLVRNDAGLFLIAVILVRERSYSKGIMIFFKSSEVSLSE
jgi:hypothetical protein